MKNIFLGRAFFAFVVTTVCVVISYLYLDRPIAFWMHAHCFSRFAVFEWMTQIAVIIGGVVALCLPASAVLAVQRPLRKTEKILFLSSLGVVVAIFLKDVAKIIFGRYWIQTWVDQNPSLLRDGAYGFHFLHSGPAYGSFPSGHTLIVFSAMTFLWFFAPKWRVLAVLLSFLEITGLLVMNFHFLSDILAGAFLGGLTSIFAIRIAKSPFLKT